MRRNFSHALETYLRYISVDVKIGLALIGAHNAKNDMLGTWSSALPQLAVIPSAYLSLIPAQRLNLPEFEHPLSPPI